MAEPIRDNLQRYARFRVEARVRIAQAVQCDGVPRVYGGAVRVCEYQVLIFV
jgi:hypothetical protein